MREQGLSKEVVAKRSAHKTAHVLELFEQQDPNPTLKLYLGVVEAAGGRLCGVSDNSPRAFVQRLSQLCERENITVSDLARRAGLNRSSLNSLLRSETPNPKLQTIDAIVTALGVEADIKLVALASAEVKLVALASGAAEVTVQEREQQVEDSKRHLKVVKSEARETGDQGPVKEAKAQLRSAREQLAASKKEVARLNEECALLRAKNIELERKVADAEANERAMALQALADAQAIQALKKARLWNGVRIFGATIGAFAVGFGVGHVVTCDKN